MKNSQLHNYIMGFTINLVSFTINLDGFTNILGQLLVVFGGGGSTVGGKIEEGKCFFFFFNDAKFALVNGFTINFWVASQLIFGQLHN